jgi:hypothetical protein
MKYLSIPPKELNTSQKTSLWFNNVFKGVFQNLNSETSTLYMIEDPENPKENSSVLWMNTDGDIKIKMNKDGVIVTKTIITFS